MGTTFLLKSKKIWKAGPDLYQEIANDLKDFMLVWISVYINSAKRVRILNVCLDEKNGRANELKIRFRFIFRNNHVEEQNQGEA